MMITRKKGVALPVDPAIGELVAALPDDAPLIVPAIGDVIHREPDNLTPLQRIEAARKANRELQKNFAEGSACWELCQEVEADLWHAAIDLA